MSVKENFNRASEEINHPGYERSVRVVVNQPISMDEAVQAVLSDQEKFHKLELTRSFWLVTGPPSIDARKAMLPGGKILGIDDDNADRLLQKKAINPEEFNSAMIVLAACRTVQEELDLHGIRHRQVGIIDPTPRLYTFNHDKKKRSEYITTVIAPAHFQPYSFFDEKHISEIHRIPPNHVRKMFKHNRLLHLNSDFPVIDNLNSEAKERINAGVNTANPDVKRIRGNIEKSITNAEINLQLKLFN